jgi:hypothetical protein
MSRDKIFWSLYNQLLVLINKHYKFTENASGEYTFKYPISAKDYREEIIEQCVKNLNQTCLAEVSYEVIGNNYILNFHWVIQTEEERIDNRVNDIFLNIEDYLKMNKDYSIEFIINREEDQVIFNKVLAKLIQLCQDFKVIFKENYSNLMILKIFAKEENDV